MTYVFVKHFMNVIIRRAQVGAHQQKNYSIIVLDSYITGR